jgi:exodeoxyribonuclease-3
VAAFSRPAPLAHATGLPGDAHTGEGRLIHLEYPAFHLLACYFPNGQRDQARLDFKLSYYEAFLAHAQELRRRKPVVACGDFNTAHTELDLARPADNRKTSGFLPVERDWLDRFVAAGWVDTFRLFRPEGGHYSWWAPWRNARARNIGWRIDYFFVSEELRHRVVRAWIEPEVQGSDHCPVGLELDV